MSFKKILGWLGGGILVSPDIFAQNYFTDQIPLLWTSGYTSYELQFSTSSDYAGASTIYSGALTNYTHTGRSADTVYYYRIRGTLAGITSDWQTAQFQTMFNPLAAYHFGGLPGSNETNYFGTLGVTNHVSSVKSFLNLSGPSITPSASDALVVNYNTNKTVFNTGLVGNAGWGDFSSDLNFGTGDFTLCWEYYVGPSLFPNQYLFSGGAASLNAVYLANNTIALRVNTTFSSFMTYPGSGIQLNSWNKFVLQNTGGNVRASCDGGLTWSNTVSRPNIGSDFYLQRWAASMAGSHQVSASFTSMLFIDSALSLDDISRWFSLGSGDSVSYDVANLNLPIQNFNSSTEPDLVNNYSNFVLGLNEKGNGDCVFSIGDNTLICVSKNYTSPDYADSYLFKYNTALNKLYTPISLGHYTTSEDPHEIGGMNYLGNAAYHVQMSEHYGLADLGTSLRIRKFGKNFNFIGYVPQSREAGVSSHYFWSDNQYPIMGRLGDTTYTIGSRFLVWPNDEISLFTSTDGGVSGSTIPLMQAGTVNQWLYAGFVYNDPLQNYLYITFENYDLIQTKVVGVGLMKFDGTTVSNMEGTWTKNVRTSGAVTLAELYANCIIVDARALTLTGNAAYPMVYTDGMIYGIAGNGNNTGYTLWRQKPGEAIVTGTPTFGGDAVVVNLSSSYMGSYTSAFHRHPIAILYKGGTTWDIIAEQINSGNWEPTLYRSTDNWSNWSKIGVLNGIDATKQHAELQFSSSYHFNQNRGVFHCSKATSSSTSFMYIRDANNLV